MNRQAFRFFHENGGYIVGQRAVCAASLARAEEEAQRRGWEARWEYEDSIPYEDCLGDHRYWCKRERNAEKHKHEITQCLLYDGSGNLIGSLGAIIDADRNYRRVVEAELASEALAELRDQDRRDADALAAINL